MSSLEDVYEEGGRWRTVARDALLFAGSLVAAVGFVAAAASLIAGFGFGEADAIAVAALLGGAVLLAGFLVRAVRATGVRASGADAQGAGAGRSQARRSRVLAVVGTVVGLTGLVLFWATLPTDWTGNLARLPGAALATYAVGLLVAFWAGRGVPSSSTDRGASPTDSERETRVESSGSLGGVESALGASADETKLERASGSSAVGDGGEEDGDLEFFDDES